MRNDAPRVQIHDNFALNCVPAAHPRRARDERQYSTALTLLNVATWAYAAVTGGVHLA